uniref:Uncharacterized protein n=1 Tax=Panagrellus redivivus TaxID=6233 RepID=A0A7E4UND8_PANRE
MFSVPTPSSSASGVDPETAASFAAAGLLLPFNTTVSTPMNPFMSLPMGLPPLPFTMAHLSQMTFNPMLPPPPSYNDAIRYLAASTPEIARLTADTTAVSIADREEANTSVKPMERAIDVTEEEDKPLDLSLKSQSTESTEASTSDRPSVIRNSVLTPPRTCDIKRSASSVSHRVTPDPDVSEHFRRSLSGKWPKRVPSHGHYVTNQGNHHLSMQSINGSSLLTRQDISRSNSPFANAPITKRLSFSSPRSGCPSPQIRRVASTPKRSQVFVCEGDKGEVESHFRRALGDETFEKLRNARAAAEAEALAKQNAAV